MTSVDGSATPFAFDVLANYPQNYAFYNPSCWAYEFLLSATVDTVCDLGDVLGALCKQPKS